MRASTSASQGLGVDVVELGGDDQAVDDGGALAAAVRTGEQPRLAAERDAAQRPLGGIVGEADPAVVQKGGEGGPAGQHVIEGFGDVGMAGQPGTLDPHPGFELVEQRQNTLLARGEARLRRLTVDLALDGEDGVDPLHCLERDRR